ncbi:2681_t:CDS:2 [Acaulospora morrowiae]|uniref:2681_t:CDS:1 n=1 Tax=Acaulospora morrowiae TaxID=94023 RepID=A0A9N8WDG8_9GLOM|nr:2681_t:CDS:2 [Acaulospora morrowiae]
MGYAKIIYKDEYFVEKIVSHRAGPNGEYQYFLKWLGYPDEDNTWEDECNIFAQDLLYEYWDQHGGRPGSSGRTYPPVNEIDRCQEDAYDRNIGSRKHRRNGNINGDSRDRGFVHRDDQRKRKRHQDRDSDIIVKGTNGTFKNHDRSNSHHGNLISCNNIRSANNAKSKKDRIKILNTCSGNSHSRFDKTSFDEKLDKSNNDFMEIDSDEVVEEGSREPRNCLGNHDSEFQRVNIRQTPKDLANDDSDNTTGNTDSSNDSDGDAGGERKNGTSEKASKENSEVIAQIEETMKILWDSVRLSSSSSSDDEEDESYELTSKRDKEDTWEKNIRSIDFIEKNVELNKTLVCITWKNGEKSAHDSKLANKKCPQKPWVFELSKERDDDVTTLELEYEGNALTLLKYDVHVFSLFIAIKQYSAEKAKRLTRKIENSSGRLTNVKFRDSTRPIVDKCVHQNNIAHDP